MKLISSIVCIALLKIVDAVDCDDINFNDGKLHINNCTGPLSWMPPLVVLTFDDTENLEPRNSNTTHYAGRPIDYNFLDNVCGETKIYDADEFSYIALGYYIEAFNNLAYAGIILELFLDNDKIAEEVVSHSSASDVWREVVVKIDKTGQLLVSTVFLLRVY